MYMLKLAVVAVDSQTGLVRDLQPRLNQAPDTAHAALSKGKDEDATEILHHLDELGSFMKYADSLSRSCLRPLIRKQH